MIGIAGCAVRMLNQPGGENYAYSYGSSKDSYEKPIPTSKEYECIYCVLNNISKLYCKAAILVACKERFTTFAAWHATMLHVSRRVQDYSTYDSGKEYAIAAQQDSGQENVCWKHQYTWISRYSRRKSTSTHFALQCRNTLPKVRYRTCRTDLSDWPCGVCSSQD